MGIIAGGDFTTPARTLVQSRNIDLFYVPKAKIVTAFAKHDLMVDYPDKSTEAQKRGLANTFEKNLTAKTKRDVSLTLRDLVGQPSLHTYVDRLRAALGALPQELRFLAQRQSTPVIFESINEASTFLKRPKFDFAQPTENFVYQITYSDGTEFEKTVVNMDELRTLHRQIERLAAHIAKLPRN